MLSSILLSSLHFTPVRTYDYVCGDTFNFGVPPFVASETFMLSYLAILLCDQQDMILGAIV